MGIRFGQYERLMVLALTLLSAGTHFWRLDQPSELVFDEIYYPKWGEDYLQGQSFFDVHPPLGKILIAIGIWAFRASPEAGVGSFGWRFTTALFGTLIVPLTYFVAKKFFQNSGVMIQDSDNAQSDSTQKIALLSALFVALDGLLLVQGRIALLDSFLVTFVLAAYLCFLSFRDATGPRATQWLLLTGVFFGLALATKWTGAAVVGVVFIWLMAFRRSLPPIKPLAILTAFVLIPALVYSLPFLLNQRSQPFFPYLWDWHIQTWNFHQGLHTSHPYESRWWSWLYLARPVWYYYKDDGGGTIRGIVALGNPILWWASIGALVASGVALVRRRHLEILLPVLAFFAAYAPWWIIGRTQFQYYLVGGAPFLFMLLAWWLVRLGRQPIWRPLVVGLILLSMAAFIFFFPLLTAYPITSGYYRQHIWFKRWI